MCVTVDCVKFLFVKILDVWSLTTTKELKRLLLALQFTQNKPIFWNSDQIKKRNEI